MGCATSIVKYLLFLFNFIFVLAGIAFIAVGAVYLLDIKTFTALLNQSGIPFTLTPTLILIIGIIVFLIAFFGCCGAIKESKCLLLTYGIILLVLFLFQVAIGSYAFTQFKDSDTLDKNLIENELRRTMQQYDRNNQAKETFDALQSQLKCCGVNHPQDWFGVTQNQIVPLSCCERVPTQCYPSSAYQEGCFRVLYSFLQRSINIIGIIIIVVGVVELSGAICALCLFCSM